MSKQQFAGVYQLENGYWGYRYAIVLNGKTKANKKVRDELGNPFKTQKQAAKAREMAIKVEQSKAMLPPQQKIVRRTVKEVYEEYCEKGRSGKAYATIKKQDSLWKNHLCKRFGSRYIDEITSAEILDFLSELYYVDDRAFSYVESFLKMFYLIYGQAYSRNYIDVTTYNRICVNKDTKIHMPKMKVDEDIDIFAFSESQLKLLDEYFKDTNAETAYMLGRYCGLRINECYGLKWSNVDVENGIISIDRQMQYQNGVIKLVSLKTRNAKRKIYMNNRLKEYFVELARQQEQHKIELEQQRQQKQTMLADIDGKLISSLELVNALPNGKIQTVNSMKYHTRMIRELYKITFKFHYLRHTYGTNLAVLNTPVHLLCNQMGHANCNVTQKYYIAISEKGVAELLKNLERI